MSLLNTTIKLRLLQLFIGGTVGNLIKPFFAAVLTLGISATVSGSVMILCGSVALLIGLSGGTHSDEIGRKRILLYGEWVRLGGAILLWAAFLQSEVNYVLAAFGFMLHSAGSAYGRPAGDALLYDNMNDLNRKLIMRLHYWVWNLTVLIGFLIGGVFFIEHKPVFFTLMFTISLLDLFIIRFFKHTISDRNLRLSDWSIKKLPLHLLRSDRRFAAFSLASTLQLTVEVGSITLLSVVMLKDNIFWTVWNVQILPLAFFGVLITVNAVVMLLGGLMQIKYLPQIDARLELWIGIACMTVGFGGLFQTKSPTLLILCVGTLSVGELFFKSSRNDLFAQILPVVQRGAYSSINSTLFRVAAAIAPVLLILYDWLTLDAITVTIAIMMIISGVLLHQVATSLKVGAASVT